MTSTVKITAHCSEDKEVRVFRLENIASSTNTKCLTKIQNGETQEFYIYDDFFIIAQEVLKNQDI